MQITIFGASGKVGRLVVMQALKRGYDVVAFVHSHDPFVATPNLRVVRGDIDKADDVRKALKGSEAVISVLGSWGRKQRNVLSSAMKSIIPGMDEQKIKRIITLTGAGAVEPGKSPSLRDRAVLTLIAPFPAGKVFRDAIEHMDLLAASDLDWTIVRSPIMTNRGSWVYHLSAKSPSLLQSISRHTVAKCLLDQLATKKYIHQSPYLYPR